MKLSKKDLSLFPASLIALTAALIAGIMLIFLSATHTGRIVQEWQTTQHQLHAAQSELLRAQQQQSTLAQFLDAYQTAVNQHLIGDEDRANLVEYLDKLREQKITKDFHYHISAQKRYTGSADIDTGNFDLYYSEIKLRFDLLHEGQLLDFLQVLHTQNNGRYFLESCEMKRNINKTSLKATCTGIWITLRYRSPAP